MSELHFQKQLVKSAQTLKWLAAITTDRFRKGRPDIMWKKPGPHCFHAEFENVMPVFVECKYVDLNSRGGGKVNVATTELQKICLKQIRNSGMTAGLLVFVTIDKKQPVVYYIHNIDTDHFNHFKNDLPKFKCERQAQWPMEQIQEQILMDHQQN